jgi:hypothetical protein
VKGDKHGFASKIYILWFAAGREALRCRISDSGKSAFATRSEKNHWRWRTIFSRLSIQSCDLSSLFDCIGSRFFCFRYFFSPVG